LSFYPIRSSTLLSTSFVSVPPSSFVDMIGDSPAGSWTGTKKGRGKRGKGKEENFDYIREEKEKGGKKGKNLSSMRRRRQSPAKRGGKGERGRKKEVARTFLIAPFCHPPADVLTVRSALTQTEGGGGRKKGGRGKKGKKKGKEKGPIPHFTPLLLFSPPAAPLLTTTRREKREKTSSPPPHYLSCAGAAGKRKKVGEGKEEKGGGRGKKGKEGVCLPLSPFSFPTFFLTVLLSRTIRSS